MHPTPCRTKFIFSHTEQSSMMDLDTYPQSCHTSASLSSDRSLASDRWRERRTSPHTKHSSLMNLDSFPQSVMAMSFSSSPNSSSALALLQDKHFVLRIASKHTMDLISLAHALSLYRSSTSSSVLALLRDSHFVLRAACINSMEVNIRARALSFSMSLTAASVLASLNVLEPLCSALRCGSSVSQYPDTTILVIFCFALCICAKYTRKSRRILLQIQHCDGRYSLG